FFEKKPFKEVGRALGISEDAAKKRIARALEKLRSIFAKEKLIYPTGAIIAALSTCSIKAAPAGLASAIVASSSGGAAVAASTLALVKQTLKLMASTQTKVAV